MTWHPETLAIHAGHHPDAETRSRAVPIYQSTSFTFPDAETAANIFGLTAPGYIYSRLGNPTVDALEQRLAAIHGATAAIAAASGMAATFHAIATLAKTGQNFVTGSCLYGGTGTLFRHTLKRFGIEARFADSSKPEDMAAKIDANTRCIFIESVGNPKGSVDDFAALAAVAKKAGIPFVVDNTFTPPPIFNPFDHGANIVVYSLTKMIGGHGTSIGGAVVENGSFDWAASGRFSDIAGPDPTYHNMNFFEAFKGAAFCTKIRAGVLRDVGACLAPLNAFLFLQGLETLALRARRHCDNARSVALFLANHPKVEWVEYAGLPAHRDHARAKTYMPMGPGAVFGFGVKGGYEAGKALIAKVKLASHLANVLDAKTLVIHPASTTHQQLTAEERRAAGVPDGMIRLSVGLEHPDDIAADLDQAMSGA